MSAPRPNILLIVIDCARSDRWLGNAKSAQTPVIDALTSGGASVPTTIAETACTTPCFASLLTGAFSFRHGISGVGGWQLVDELRTLPERLRGEGYHSYAEVTGPLVPTAGCHRGFDEYNYRLAFDFLHARWGDMFLERLAKGGYREPWFILLHLWELHLVRQVRPEFDRPEFGRNRYDRAVSSLDTQLGRIMHVLPPNTLTVITGDHGEKTSDETYRPGTAVDYARGLYESDRAGGLRVRTAAMLIGPVAMQELRTRLQPLLEQFSQRDTPRRLDASRWAQTRDLLRLLRLAPLLRLRDLLALRKPAKLTRVLKERGVLDPERNRRRVDALVCRVGLEHLFDMYLRMWVRQFRKNLEEGHMLHVYDYLVRVPLVLHWPGHLPAGRRCGRMVRQVDIAPSLLELIGVAGMDGGAPDGHSFVPLLDGRPWRPRPAYLGVSGQPRDVTLRGVRTETHKYTYGPTNPALPRELYDLRRDPQEQHNIAADGPDLCEELQSLAESMLPEEGPRVQRVEELMPHEQRTIETRLRELGYVE